MSFEILITCGFLFGIGFGFCVQRAGLCFSAGLAEVFLGHGKRIERILAIILAITFIGFLASGYLNPSLGLKPIGHIRGYGFYNLLAGLIFGAGMLLSGGCILGTLRQIGEGNLTFIVVLAAFIPGMAFVVHVLNPLLGPGYAVQKPLLSELLGVGAPYISIFFAAGALVWFAALSKRRRQQKRLSPTHQLPEEDRERRAG